MVQSESTRHKAGTSVAGALVVCAFVYVVFDNLALALIAGVVAASAGAARKRKEPGTE